MYIRPVLFGSGPRIGLQASDEYTFAVMVLPVADYYQGGMRAVTAAVVEGYDRAAPRGVGHVKVAGNYAADMLKEQGYPIALYLDAKTNSFVGEFAMQVVLEMEVILWCVSAEEFSTSNFIAVDRRGTYVTPDSTTILASITNKSLMQKSDSAGALVGRLQRGGSLWHCRGGHTGE